MKAWVPNAFKFPFWWVFKSPQRKFGLITLYNDLLGIFQFLFRRFFISVQPKPITICVGIFNRSEIFLTHFIPSLAQCNHSELIELSIVDCGSTDVSDLQAQIQKVYKGKLIFYSDVMPFTRASSFNKAVQQASHSLIFICDADFSLPRDLVQKCSDYTGEKTFWFPIVFYLYKNKPPFYHAKHGEWMLWGGKGIVACYKKDFEQLGGLNEKYTSWGGEDEEFYLRCYENNMRVIRCREKHLLHHWHPSFNPKYKKLE